MPTDVITWITLIITVVILVAALLVVTLDNLIGAVAVSGIVSIGVTVLFLLLRTPDVAMTEAAVGAGLSGVVLALGLRRRARASDRHHHRRARYRGGRRNGHRQRTSHGGSRPCVASPPWCSPAVSPSCFSSSPCSSALASR
jgi:energy-converting hydrogenase B subunit D